MEVGCEFSHLSLSSPVLLLQVIELWLNSFTLSLVPLKLVLQIVEASITKIGAWQWTMPISHISGSTGWGSCFSSFTFGFITLLWNIIQNTTNITRWGASLCGPKKNHSSQQDNSGHFCLPNTSLVAPSICGHALELLLCVLQSSHDDSKDRVAVASNSSPPMSCHEHQQIQVGKMTEKRTKK